LCFLAFFFYGILSDGKESFFIFEKSIFRRKYRK